MARRFVMSLAVASCVVVGFLAVFSVDRPHAVYLTTYVVLSVSLVSFGVLGRWGALGWASASLDQRLRRW